jgi:hypothetical protein
MQTTRRHVFRLLAGTILATSGLAADATAAPKRAAGNANVAGEPRVFLLRGLLNVFSLGMDTLAEKLNAAGIRAEVHPHDSWSAVAASIASDYRRGLRGPVVLIGHSLGADVIFSLAERLDSEGVPVRLMVAFDPTNSYAAPKNVDYMLNLFQHNGFGRRVAAGPGFRGELNNMDLTSDKSIDHTSIDKSPALHNLVINKIRAVTAPGAQKRRPASRK